MLRPKRLTVLVMVTVSSSQPRGKGWHLPSGKYGARGARGVVRCIAVSRNAPQGEAATAEQCHLKKQAAQDGATMDLKRFAARRSQY